MKFIPNNIDWEKQLINFDKSEVFVVDFYYDRDESGVIIPSNNKIIDLTNNYRYH